MANICITDFRLIGTKESAEKMRDFINSLQGKTNLLRNYGMYNAFKELGCENVDNDVVKRATAYDLNINPYQDKFMLSFMTESAWEEPSDMISFINDKLGLNMSINYHAEEPMMQYINEVGDDNVFSDGYRIFDENEFADD